ncbi:MAG: sigma factor [Aquihabitans sp.]
MLSHDQFLQARERTHRAIHRRFRRAVNHHDALDLTDEVFLQAWQSRHRYDPSAGSPEMWIHGIANNTHRRHVRTAGRRTATQQRAGTLAGRTSDGDVSDRVIDQVAAAAALIILAGAIQELGATDLELLTRSTIVALTGRHGGVISNSAHVRLHRIRQKLRRSIPAID